MRGGGGRFRGQTPQKMGESAWEGPVYLARMFTTLDNFWETGVYTCA